MAFIPSRIKKHNTDPGQAKLNLNSMMDMFTIILLFLLKTYSTEGQLISPSHQLTLPKSTIEQPPEVGLDLVVSKKLIMVNDQPVAKVPDVIRNAPGVVEQGVIKPLSAKLKYFASHAKKMEAEYGVKFSGKITIQADKDLHYAELVKVMRTCGLSDYPNMRLVVYRKEE
ncbi:MAG: biopolymer transporter ExbD [Calditrichaeota bacterium]|nr:MAG: biopolymer transporter ExbD [Calditrichota bacterium]